VKLVCYADWPEDKRLVYEGSESPVQFSVRDAYGRISKTVTRFDSALLMEYCQSGSLEEYVPYHMRRGTHDKDSTGSTQWLGTARRFFAEILLALDFLHNTKSVIYRDLKLDNVFVVNDSAGLPHVKLGDFGFSKVVNDSDKPTSIAGSPYFAAPEMMAMHRQHTSYPTDWSLDVFSFGVLVFVVLYGADHDDDSNNWAMAHHKKGSDAMHPIHASSGFSVALAELVRQDRAPASAISLIQKATSREQKERPSVVEMMASPLFQELSWPDGRSLPAIDWYQLKRTNLED
jgi:serine/threonine protein kinase